jgi:hypothetical protein
MTTVTDSFSTPTGSRLERPHTGDHRVDQVAAGLDRLDDLPVDEHPSVYDEVDSGLRGVLGAASDPARDEAAPEAASGTQPGA